jgi:hypothetical protein
MSGTVCMSVAGPSKPVWGGRGTVVLHYIYFLTYRGGLWYIPTKPTNGRSTENLPPTRNNVKGEGRGIDRCTLVRLRSKPKGVHNATGTTEIPPSQIAIR